MKRTCYIRTEKCKSGFWKGSVVFENGCYLLATAAAVSEEAARQAAKSAVPIGIRLVASPVPEEHPVLRGANYAETEGK